VRRLLGITAGVLALASCAPDPPAAIVGIRAEGCGVHIGSGAFIAVDTVLTAAHTVAGAESLTVIAGGRSLPAQLIALDAANDLALVRADGPPGKPLPIHTHKPEAGSAAVAYVVRDGEVVSLPVTIVRRITVETTDIYREEEVSRPGFEISGAIEPGDSGAAVVAEGALVGVVWARSNQSLGRSYATDPAAVPTPVSTERGRCVG
jgi:S1-C subfamily serine protease